MIIIQSGSHLSYKAIYWVNILYRCPLFGHYFLLVFFHEQLSKVVPRVAKQNVKRLKLHANVVNKYETQNKNPDWLYQMKTCTEPTKHFGPTYKYLKKSLQSHLIVPICTSFYPFIFTYSHNNKLK